MARPSAKDEAVRQGPPATHSRPQIVLVEDNPSDARLVQEGLGEIAPDAELVVAPDAATGLGVLSDGPPPDLVLLDLHLPDRDGVSMLNELRGRCGAGRATPVVVLSGSQNPEDIQRCYAACANGYVTKPADLTGYFAAIEAIMAFWLHTAASPGR